MPIVLPKERSVVENRWVDQKIGMIGPAGIGKSEFWSHGDKTLYIQTEAGLNHLAVKKIVCRDYADWLDIRTALSVEAGRPNFPYDTIVIDTIDRLIDFVNEAMIQRGKDKFKNMSSQINTIGDIPNGAGWMWATKEIEAILTNLETLPACITFIGHLDIKEIKEPTRSIHKQTISVGGKTGRQLVAWCDHFLNIDASYVGQKQVRRVRTIPTNTVEAKSRGGVIKDGWIWEEDSKVNWNKLRGAFK